MTRYYSLLKTKSILAMLSLLLMAMVLGSCETNDSVEPDDDKEEECCTGELMLMAQFENEDGEMVPYSNSMLYLVSKKGDVIRVETDDDGKAYLPEVCEGSYWFGQSPDTEEMKEYNIKVVCEEKTEAVVTMPSKNENSEDCCDNTASIMLEGFEGDYAYIILKRDGKPGREVKTETGKVEFEELCKGVKYTIVVEAEGYQRQEMTIGPFEDCGISSAYRVMMEKEKEDCCDAEMMITVKSGDDYLDDARIELYRKGKIVEDGDTSDNGQVNLKELCEGEYVLVVKKEGYKAIEKSVRVICEENNSIDITLEKKEEGNEECCDSEIGIYVIDSQGNSIVEGEAVLKRDGKVIQDTRFDDGEIEFEELCKGDGYYFIVYGKEMKPFESEKFAIKDCDSEMEFSVKLEKK
ncbi:MAG: hypothetical protein Kapaf2KO_06710 [Candidatus Kapaibacteriales bacterium]